jgi:TolB protein
MPGLNGKIACASGRIAGNTEIFSFNPNGTELETTRLTFDPAFDGRPKYSPDGRLIAFESNRSGSTEIWIMNADGSNPRRLTFSGANTGATWSPGGDQLAYQSIRIGQFQISRINIDGTGETQLTSDSQESTLPNWSPDGGRIAFSSRRDDPNADVYTMNPDGTGVVRVPIPGNVVGVEDSWPSWSPDGTQLAIHSRRDDALGEEIYRTRLDGTNVVRLTFNTAPLGGPNSDLFPVWSPDGTRISWTSGRDGNSLEAYHMSAVDGSDIRRVTNNSAPDQRCDWQPLCTIYGSGDILGTPGNDIICGSDGIDRIFGNGGNDRIVGLGGDDQIVGNLGNDSIFGGAGNDRITGRGGVDVLDGGIGTDQCVGAVQRSCQ